MAPHSAMTGGPASAAFGPRRRKARGNALAFAVVIPFEEEPPAAALSAFMADIDESDSAAALLPNDSDLDQLPEAAAECTACPLYRNATQTVFGKG